MALSRKAGLGTPREVIAPKDPMQAADADMKKVLEQLRALHGKPLGTTPPAEARTQPSPAAAVRSLLEMEGKSTEPVAMASVQDMKIPGAVARIDARIYTPKSGDGRKPRPVILYFHGGGWVLGDLRTHDASARALADASKAIVVSAEYRHAPEAKFPAAHDDAIAAYEWVLANAASLGGDPRRVALAGESAGGNLAANVAIAARDKGLQMPVHQLLVYPVASTSMDTRSYAEWANAKPLGRSGMRWLVEQTVAKPADLEDARLDLVNADLHGLPPATIVLAEIDPLRSEGELLGDKLEAAGVEVAKKIYEGVTHEFFGMGAAVGAARSAVSWAAGRLDDAFAEKG